MKQEIQTSDVLKKINIPRHKLYYLEQKGYIKPKKITRDDLEMREYTDEDFHKTQIIWNFSKRGSKHKIAYKKAIEKLNKS